MPSYVGPVTTGRRGDAIESQQSGMVLLGVRTDADTGTESDGQLTPIRTNQFGRLKVSSMPGAYDLVTGNVTTSSSVVNADVARTSNVMVQVTGTFTGVNLTFEGSLNNTDWVTVQAVRTNANRIENTTGVIATGLGYAWELSVNAFNVFRVRSTAYTSGTATVLIQRGAFATEPIPAIQGPSSSTATHTSVAGSTSSVSLLAANPLRRQAVIYNESTAVLYVNLTGTATTTAYIVAMAANSYYEVPAGYQGVIAGIWAAANGNARVTELS